MLSVQPIIQTTGMCGPACLAMVMAHFGVRVPLRRVQRVSGATRAIGLLPPGFLKAAKAFGFQATVKDQASFADLRAALRAGIPPIVNWFSESEGHYSIVVDLTPRTITLLDPESGTPLTMPVRVFERIWFGVHPEPARTVRDFHLRRVVFVQPAARVTSFPAKVRGRVRR